jgi:recombinational DNA repair protein (RecF pathway)
MAIEKYTTRSIVVETYDSGEHDKMLMLFTREFGMVRAKATSVRKLESKMRGHLLPRKSCLVTLVKGREVWRIVGVEGSEVLPALGGDVAAILQRFVRGEGAHRALYDRISALLLLGGECEASKVRLLLYFIVLVDLGYADVRVIGVSTIEEYIAFSVSDMYTHLVLSYDAVRFHVVNVLKETHL